MKHVMMMLMVLCAASIADAGHLGQVLFRDSFDRAGTPQVNDIDATSVGMSGSAAPMTYVETGDDVIALSAGLTNVEYNQLHVADGPNMTLMYLDHNFVEPQIALDGGMRLGITIVTNDGTLTGEGYWVGFGIGNTLQECIDAQFDHNGPGLRGAYHGGRTYAGSSDIWVEWGPANNGVVRVFKNGPASAGGINYDIPVGPLVGNDRLELELYFNDFTAGSLVDALVYWHGQVVAVESFAWDNTDSNYVGLSSRQNNAGFTLDNLAIETLYNEHAYNPVPADTTVRVTPGTINLQWNKGRDAAGQPNAAIGTHYLYATTAVYNGEPNFAAPETLYLAEPVTDTPDPVVKAITLDYDQTLYWRVDESVNGSAPDEPNTIEGFVWQFSTQRSIPIIAAGGQPVDVLRYPYTDPAYEGDAAFSCQFLSISTPTVRWYRAANPNNPVDAASDPDITIETIRDGNNYTTTLTIANVELADQDTYYCILENDSGAENAVTSATANLGVKRLVGYWPLDGDYQDLGGDGHHGDPNVAPDPGQWIDGADPAKTGRSLNFVPEPLVAADTGAWAPSAFTGQISLSAWIKWNGPNGMWQGIVSNRLVPAEGNFYVEIRNDNTNVQINTANAADLQGPNLPVGQWAHLAVTAAENEWTIYINGLPVATRTPAAVITRQDYPLYLGALQRNNGTLASRLNGVLDEVRIYNYVLSPVDIAELYYAVLEIPVCINPEAVDLAMDVAGGGPDGDQPDCKVNIADFAAFARDWMRCGLIPQSECK